VPDAPAQEPGEAAALAAASRRARRLDAELARALGMPEPAGEPLAEGYYAALARRAPQDPEGERRLIERAAGGDPRARAKLIDATMPRIAAVAREYRMTPVIDRGEMLQAGAVGLLETLERYDPAERTPFWPFAKRYVRRRIRRTAAELIDAFVLSDRTLRELSRIRDAQEELWHELRRDATLDELVERTGLPRERVAEVLSAARPPRSKDELITTPDGDVLGKLEERLPYPRAEEDYDDVLDHVESEELLSLLSTLSDRERRILWALYVDERTAAEVGAELGIAAERVQRTAMRACRKLMAAARKLGAAV
jgi:RNA polymerase sigma factor (sigma-70 family)